MPSPLLVADQLSRTFRVGGASVDALRNASCVVMPGQRIALTGPSGSGKSTLLHLLGGLDQPDRGRIEWPGLGSRSDLRPKQVVDIFQGPSLLEPLSVIENVKLPLLLAGLTDQAAEITARIALEQFGIERLANKLPEEISGGQAQRVSIARALAVRPALILADEPTGQLDIATAATVLQTILDAVGDLGAAIIISTHDRRLADRLDEQWSMLDGVLDTGIEDKINAVTVAESIVEARPQ